MVSRTCRRPESHHGLSQIGHGHALVHHGLRAQTGPAVNHARAVFGLVRLKSLALRRFDIGCLSVQSGAHVGDSGGLSPFLLRQFGLLRFARKKC